MYQFGCSFLKLKLWCQNCVFGVWPIAHGFPVVVTFVIGDNCSVRVCVFVCVQGLVVCDKSLSLICYALKVANRISIASSLPHHCTVVDIVSVPCNKESEREREGFNRGWHLCVVLLCTALMLPVHHIPQLNNYFTLGFCKNSCL